MSEPTPPTAFGWLNRVFDRWLTAPERNAAGRMGLFRMVFSLFLIWQASQGHFVLAAQMPTTAWRPIALLSWLPHVQTPSPLFYYSLEAAFIFTLVLLLIGYRVRLMTLLVLVLGFVLEAFRLSFGRIEHGSVFQSFYIPLIMLFSQWGATYSLDSLLRRRRTGIAVEPSDSSWRYIWPMRVLLLLLSFLFLTAAYFKLAGTGWLTNPDVFANVLLRENVEITAKGYAAPPLLLILAQLPLVTVTFRFATLAFEGLFFVSLLGNRLRNFIVSVAMIFHALNALLLYVSFTYMLIIYGLFVDWHDFARRWTPHSVKRLTLRLSTVSSPALVGGTLALALIFAALWATVPFFRHIFDLGGLLDWRTIWIPLLPLSVLGFIRSTWALVSAAWQQLQRRRNPASSANGVANRPMV
jgi:hypothetical protein